jgi:hypothetical protein
LNRWKYGHDDYHVIGNMHINSGPQRVMSTKGATPLKGIEY